MQTFFLAPTGFGVGLTSTSLGLLHALQRSGLKVGFCKLIAQQHEHDTGPEPSSELIRRTLGVRVPEPIALSHAERLLGDGHLDDLSEQCLKLFYEASQDSDVVVVEGMVPTRKVGYAATLNASLARSLGAEVLLVSAPDNDGLEQLVNRIEVYAQQLAGNRADRVAGVIINKAPESLDEASIAAALRAAMARPLPIVGVVPWNEDLNAARTLDVARELKATILHEGEISTRRMKKIILCARALANTVELFQPHVLAVTPGDRDDIIVAASMAAANGVQLAGLLLCTGFEPDPRILKLCKPAMEAGLPVMTVQTGSYDTATSLNRMNNEIPVDDQERAEKVTEFVADHLKQDWLLSRCDIPHQAALSPAAFRYQMVVRAQQANKRIVLPEGAEPRTVQAAVICHSRNIARCVLLAKRDEVETVAEAHGLTLPDSLEIIDPDSIREHYVAPMVVLRKNRGLTEPMALAQLEDPVVLGTMMLAQDDVDGLVSGAINTTANTIRPALQLIKTAPGFNLVSSVFFMLLPDQVLVYGDCAVNPDPNAQELAEIAIQSAESALAFGIEPRVAMISYSTGSSGTGADVEKVREATRIAQEKRPDLAIDGPLQYDAAAIESVGRQKAPDSAVAGQATVFIFPDLNTGNTTYKAVQRATHSLSVGPMLQGLRKPVNDLSRGALVDDIVYTIALTAIQAASRTDPAP